ncbi:MAG: S8 family serine peptidase, partial [Erysipelotrichaceae bacterium]|nr:S8 family serine peptidase [Erysipelotrichaceae bacterium]
KELLESLKDDPRVLFAEPNYIVSSAADQSEDLDQVKEAVEDVLKEKEEETKTSDLDGSGFQENEESETEDSILTEIQELAPSNWGPSGFSEEHIPDMTEWQWSNYNKGNLNGSYQHEGSSDIQYEAWKTQEKENIKEYVVAVLDDGIDETNPDLAGVLWNGEAFDKGGDCHGFFPGEFRPGAMPGTSTTGLYDYHGTHVAGILASDWNGQGISGAAPNVKLMSLRHQDSLATILACYKYAKKAVENGVNLIAINNSWNLGMMSSNLINAAMTELGEAGVVSVVATGNDYANTDRTISTITHLANNPYTVIVNAMSSNGQKSCFSNYGIGTTEVFAPGSMILSTGINDPAYLQFFGEVNAHAPEGSEARNNLVSYTSFDEESISPFDTFQAIEGTDCIYPVDQPASGSFDGTGVLSVKTNEQGLAVIETNTKNLSELEVKPRYVSVRVNSNTKNCIARAYGIGVPIILTSESGEVMNGIAEIYIDEPMPAYFKGDIGTFSGGCFDLAEAESAVPEKYAAKGFTKSYIDWKNFKLILMANNRNLVTEQYEPVTLHFDSIGLGSGRYPYIYARGTSMASPSATGVLSVLAGRYADMLGEEGTAEFAEKLAALVKGAAVPNEQLEDLCATGGVVSVAGGDHPGPAIVKIEDGKSEFTVTGYFMQEAVVSLNGTNCSVQSKSLGNDKYELTVQKPDGYQGGTPVVTVSGPNGKKDRSVLPISEASGKEAPGLFDNSNIPLPSEISNWFNYDLVGYNGKVYFLERTVLNGSSDNYSNSIFVYDPSNGEWEKIIIPVEKLTGNAQTPIRSISDATGCVKDGKLILLITGAAENGTYQILVSLDQNGNFEQLGWGIEFEEIRANTTLTTDGKNLYLVNGFGDEIDENGNLSYQFSRYIYQLTIDPNKHLMAEPKIELNKARAFAHVTYTDNTFIVSGGDANDGTIEKVVIGQPAESINIPPTMIKNEPNLSFSSGALADGTIILTGPVSADGTADTYLLNQDGTLSLFDKRAYHGHLMMPASLAYNGNYYVLAAIAPVGDERT